MEHSPHHGQSNNVTRPSSEFRSDWQIWSITALSLITLVLLCQPWLAAKGPYGDVHADPFGRLEGSVPALSTPGVHMADTVVSISGLWGMLTAAAAVVTLLSAQLYRKSGVGLSLILGGSLATVVFVPVTLLYLDGKVPELRDMTKNHDALKDTIGTILNAFLGGPESGAGMAQQEATGGLTAQALLCGLIAVLTAAVASSIRRRNPAAAADAVTSGEIVHQFAVGELPTDGPGGTHGVGEVPEESLDEVLWQVRDLTGRVDPVREETLDPVDHRLLPRGERPRRTDNRTGQTRRERNSARYPRSRPANRTAGASQPMTGSATARSNRPAARARCSTTAAAVRPRAQV